MFGEARSKIGFREPAIGEQLTALKRSCRQMAGLLRGLSDDSGLIEELERLSNVRLHQRVGSGICETPFSELQDEDQKKHLQALLKEYAETLIKAKNAVDEGICNQQAADDEKKARHAVYKSFMVAYVPSLEIVAKLAPQHLTLIKVRRQGVSGNAVDISDVVSSLFGPTDREDFFSTWCAFDDASSGRCNYFAYWCNPGYRDAYQRAEFQDLAIRGLVHMFKLEWQGAKFVGTHLVKAVKSVADFSEGAGRFLQHGTEAIAHAVTNASDVAETVVHAVGHVVSDGGELAGKALHGVTSALSDSEAGQAILGIGSAIVAGIAWLISKAIYYLELAVAKLHAVASSASAKAALHSAALAMKPLMQFVGIAVLFKNAPKTFYKWRRNLHEGYKTNRTLQNMVATVGAMSLGAAIGMALKVTAIATVSAFGLTLGGPISAAFLAGAGFYAAHKYRKTVGHRKQIATYGQTNPEKYALTSKQAINLKEKGQLDEVVQLIAQLRAIADVEKRSDDALSVGGVKGRLLRKLSRETGFYHKTEGREGALKAIKALREYANNPSHQPDRAISAAKELVRARVKEHQAAHTLDDNSLRNLVMPQQSSSVPLAPDNGAQAAAPLLQKADVKAVKHLRSKTIVQLQSMMLQIEKATPEQKYILMVTAYKLVDDKLASSHFTFREDAKARQTI